MSDCKPLAEFARRCLKNGSFLGCDIDGGEAQDWAVELGILIETTYDPALHGESEDAEPGDPWFVFAPWVKEMLA